MYVFVGFCIGFLVAYKDVVNKGDIDGVSLQEIKMPFGKFKGVRLRDVPYDYLLWCKNNGVLRKYPKILQFFNGYWG